MRFILYCSVKTNQNATSLQRLSEAQSTALTTEIESEQRNDESTINMCVTASKPDEFPKLKIFRDR